MVVEEREALRFTQPVDSTRPPGAHRYEVASPKLGRRLRLFNRIALDQWVLLEADAGVRTFCERPQYLGTEGGAAILIDFWVQRDTYHKFLIVAPETPASIPKETTPSPRTVSVADIVARATWISNWRGMLPCLVTNRRWIDDKLMDDILSLCATASPIGDLERELAPIDPMLVRTAVFQALASGRLSAPTLHTEPLTSQTVITKTQESLYATQSDCG